MIGWGMLGGAALGALYGVVIAFTMLVDFQRGSIWNALPGILVGSVVYGVPFGAIFGGIAGGLLGILNGFTAGVLTKMIFSLSRNWGWYRLSIGLVTAGFALVGGMLVFGMLMNPYRVSDFVLEVGIPAMIAAIVFGRVSQRVARRHLAAVTASKPSYTA